MFFCLYFSSIHVYYPKNTQNSLVHKSWNEMERCEKRAFQLLNMRKMIFSCDLKTKYVTNVFLSVRSSSLKDYTCHQWVSTWKPTGCLNFNINKENLENFCVQLTGYLNTKKSFSISLFVLITSGNVSYVYNFPTLQQF